MSGYSRLLRLATVGVAATVLWSCHVTATSIVYPSFSAIEVFGDRVTFLSVDRKTLRCTTFDGREVWRRSFVADAFVDRLDDGHLQVQDGNAVVRINVADGAADKLFDVSDHQLFVKDRTNGLAYLTDLRFEYTAFQLVDAQSRRPIWKRHDIETIVDAKPELVAAVTAKRNYEPDLKSFTRSEAAITGLDRKTGDVRWRVLLKDHQAGSVKAIATPACLVVIDGAPGGGLLCIELASGRVLSKRPNSTDWRFFDFYDVVAQGDGIVSLEQGTNAGEAFLRFRSVPSFEVSESVRLVDGEMFAFTLHGDHVVTQGLYSAACFERRTGRRLWERGQVGDWEILEKDIVLSDYDERRQRVRLVMVEMATGKERVLLTEPARFPPR